MQTEVLIVGGGLSGLALADHLSQQGVDFLLVEAHERLGGRILTKTLSGGKFDLGPAWFWPGQPRLAELVRRFEIPIFEQYSTGDLIYQDQSGAVQRGRGYASMQGSYRLSGGMGRLIDALEAQLDYTKILNGTRLKSVRYETNGITAILDQNATALTVSARKIVLAAPPRVIAETVVFEPGLTAAQLKSLQSVPTWMAGQAKIVVVYDDPHWRNAGLSGDAMSRRGPLVEIHDASQMEGGPYALFGFVGVPPNVRDAHAGQLEKLALSQLIDLFGEEMSNPIALFFQDWANIPEIARSEDRRTRGSYPSYGLPECANELAAHGIHFSATETAQEFGGFLEGALEAAERTAGHLHQSRPVLHPQPGSGGKANIVDDPQC